MERLNSERTIMFVTFADDTGLSFPLHPFVSRVLPIGDSRETISSSPRIKAFLVEMVVGRWEDERS